MIEFISHLQSAIKVTWFSYSQGAYVPAKALDIIAWCPPAIYDRSMLRKLLTRKGH